MTIFDQSIETSAMIAEAAAAAVAAAVSVEGKNKTHRTLRVSITSLTSYPRTPFLLHDSHR